MGVVNLNVRVGTDNAHHGGAMERNGFGTVKGQGENMDLAS